jgi:hypothetical protein
MVFVRVHFYLKINVRLDQNAGRFALDWDVPGK